MNQYTCTVKTIVSLEKTLVVVIYMHANLDTSVVWKIAGLSPLLDRLEEKDLAWAGAKFQFVGENPKGILTAELMPYTKENLQRKGEIAALLVTGPQEMQNFVLG